MTGNAPPVRTASARIRPRDSLTGVPTSDAASPATRALRRARVPHTLLSYQHEAGNRHFGQEGADKLGRDPATMFKTLVVSLQAGSARSPLAVAVVPVDRHLDLKAIAAAMGAKKAVMAAPEEAERATGYVVGGISPLGQRRTLPTCIDSSALDHPTMIVSGGRRGLSVELDPHDLVRLTNAVLAPVAA